MLKTVRISQYRGFRSLAIEDLTRVTLLVGPNNAGKTSVLEAIEVLLGGGSPRSLLWGPSRRGEFLYGSDERNREADVAHLFCGHAAAEGSRFRIEGDNNERRFVEAEIVHEPDLPAEKEPRQAELPLAQELKASQSLGLLVVSERGTTHVPISPEGGVSYDYLRRRVLPHEIAAAAPVTFLANDDELDIGGMWDKIVLTAEEQKVIDALRIIEPGIERIAALRQGRYSSPGMVVKLVGSDLRLPLGSMGDGIRHLLALSICLANAAGGYLLVDEIDTGLHHTVMSKMWKLLVETAIRLDVQVIAATHSGDCLRSLASLYENSPHLRETVSLHRIEKGQATTTRYSSRELAIAAEQDIEVR